MTANRPKRSREMEVRRQDLILKPDIRRVLFRAFELGDPGRPPRIIARIMELPESQVESLLDNVLTEFRGRHQRLTQFFLQRFEAVKAHLLTDRRLSEARKLLIGAYFTQEYALESAALFNPSMIWHPDQSGVPEGSRRFILSLRATGEGHISSLSFRSGVVDRNGQVTMDPPTGFVTTPDVVPNATYEKALFKRKLYELGLTDGFVETVLALLDEHFTLSELENAVTRVLREHRNRLREWQTLVPGVLGLAKANYEIECDPESDISERSIFPYSPTEKNGIEDARFVEFVDDDGTRCYYATYTAFDGSVVFPQLLETNDFVRFRISTLNGPEVKNKGMALFPRKIDGKYAMLSRQDGENLYLMYSEMLHFWYEKQQIVRPTFPWEFVQIGNCGSPIETDRGWLVLSHGVGPMRKYSIGAFLLDRDDPSRLIARLEEPLLAPNENERAGYVPNVVYSCGALTHNGILILPYSMSDYATTFATIPVDQLLDAMAKVD